MAVWGTSQSFLYHALGVREGYEHVRTLYAEGGIRFGREARRETVEPEKLPRLEEALNHNEPLSIGYLSKEAVGLPWEQPSYARMKAFLHKGCPCTAASGVRRMRQLANTFRVNRRGLLTWWKHRVNNGRMEGTNHKNKTLLRQTCGLRDERYSVLRLYALQHSRHELLG